MALARPRLPALGTRTNEDVLAYRCWSGATITVRLHAELEATGALQRATVLVLSGRRLRPLVLAEILANRRLALRGTDDCRED